MRDVRNRLFNNMADVSYLPYACKKIKKKLSVVIGMCGDDPMTQPSLPLTEQLRSASVRKHSMSDSIVNARLLTVLVDRVLYARALSCFYWILSRIESDLTQAAKTDQRTPTSLMKNFISYYCCYVSHEYRPCPIRKRKHPSLSA